MIVNDYRTSPYAHPRFRGEAALTAVLAEPLRFRKRLIGVIVVNLQADGRGFGEDDQQLLRLFADQATIAIENARLYAEAERQRREGEVVAAIAQRITATLDLDVVLQDVAEEARRLCGCDLAQIALRDASTDTLAFCYRAGAHAERLHAEPIERGKGVGGRVLLTGQPFRTADYAKDPRITKDYLANTRAEGVVAELAVPIRVGEHWKACSSLTTGRRARSPTATNGRCSASPIMPPSPSKMPGCMRQPSSGHSSSRPCTGRRWR